MKNELTKSEYRLLCGLKRNVLKQENVLSRISDDMKIQEDVEKNIDALKSYSIRTHITENHKPHTFTISDEMENLYDRQRFQNGYIAGLKRAFKEYEDFLKAKYDAVYDFKQWMLVQANARELYGKEPAKQKAI